MSIEKVNQPVVSAIRYVQLSHFCQQRAVPDRVEGFTLVYCNNIRVINQYRCVTLWRIVIIAAVVDPVGLKANWSSKVRHAGGCCIAGYYVALDYSPLHSSRQDRCYRNRFEIGMLCGHSNFGNWTNPGLLHWLYIHYSTFNYLSYTWHLKNNNRQNVTPALKIDF